MKSFFLILFSVSVYFANAQANNPSKPAFKIDLQIKPFQNEWVYLAYYYGSIKGLADSAYLDANSRGVFTGSKPLQQGVYLVASPTKSILFELLIPEDQVFSISMNADDLTNPPGYEGSEENKLFNEYTAFINPRATAAEDARKQLDQSTDEKERGNLQALINQNLNEIAEYRKNFIGKYPENMLSVLFKTMMDVPLPEALRSPKSKEDSINQYRYGKEHYWDNFDFMDGRLVRTPVFETKLKNYLSNWVVPDADSIIYEMSWMMALGRNDPEMSKYLISYFIDNYMYPKVMGHDKVFLSAYERYVANDNPITSWLNEAQRKGITERAYMIMANQLGTPAANMVLPDTAGTLKNLYDLKANYTVVVFWDPHCGKCKEELPKIDSLYNGPWKGKGVSVYSVMVNESAKVDWEPYIRKTGKGWVHVHQPVEMREKEEKENIANFRQLYDMRSTPTLFLLDKEKRIVAKNLGLEDLNNVLEQKIKQSKQGS